MIDRILIASVATAAILGSVAYGASAPGAPFLRGSQGAPAAAAAPVRPAGGEKTAVVVKAPDSPVQIDRATVLTSAGAPPVVLYSATNTTTDTLDQFTLIAFVFDADGVLKATHIAPGRRTLTSHETKFSAMVIDGAPVGATDAVVVGVNQAQRVDSDAWWRADLQTAAEATQRKATPAR